MANFTLASGVFSILLAIYFWIRLPKGTALGYFKEPNDDSRPAIFMGLAAIALNLSLSNLMSQAFPNADSTQSTDLLKLMNDTVGISIVVTLVCVMTPVAEEFIFRGLIIDGYQALYKIKATAALALSAVLFAISHGLNHFLGGFVFALILGFLRIRSDSIRRNTAFHALSNAIGLAIIYFKVTITLPGAIALLMAGILFLLNSKPKTQVIA